MRFKGQLLIPSEPGPGLRVDLEVAEHHLAVESEDGELGAWPLEAVQVRRLESDTFSITVAGEDLHFVADDTIAFAYSGVPAIESVSRPRRPGTRLRGLLARFGPDVPDLPQVPEESSPAPDDEASPAPADEASPATPPVVEKRPGAPEPVAAEIRHLGTGEEVMEEDEVGDMTTLVADFDRAREHSYTPEAEESHEPMAKPRQPETSASEEPQGDSPRCPGLTNEGLPCRSPILGSSGYCFNHDPGRSVEDDYRKALEARAKLKREGTARLTKAYSRLEKAMRQVERGELEPDIAIAMAQLARTMCAILDLDDEEPEDHDGGDLAPRF